MDLIGVIEETPPARSNILAGASTLYISASRWTIDSGSRILDRIACSGIVRIMYRWPNDSLMWYQNPLPVVNLIKAEIMVMPKRLT